MRLIDSLKRQLVHAKAPSHRRAMMKELLLLTLLAVLTFFPGSAFAQKAACSSLTITGHPEYPPIGYKDGERIVGAGATLVERIGGELKIPVQSKYAGSWAEAQMAARDGKVDIIFGIYFNDERANYLEYVRPAFLIDPVVVMVPKGKAFPSAGARILSVKRASPTRRELWFRFRQLHDTKAYCCAFRGC
jgi:polar amino acid transport system substrate-binding protein